METIIPMENTPDTPTKSISRYFSLIGKVLLSPSHFFRENHSGFSLSDAITFGLVSSWVASCIAFAMHTMNSLFLTKVFERWVQRIMASEEGFSLLSMNSENFLWSAGVLVLDPFMVLLRIFFGTISLYLFTRLLIEDDPLAREPVTFKGLMKIQAIAFTSQWFLVVPIFGGLLAYVAHLILMVVGIRERYNVSTRRALATVMAPYVLLFVAAVLFLIILGFAVASLPFEELFDFNQKPFDFGVMKSFFL
jgi:hypothetical protein